MKQAHVFVCYGAVSFDAALRIAESVLTKGDPLHFLLMFNADTNRLPQGVVAHKMDPPPHLLSEWRKPFAIAGWFTTVLATLEREKSCKFVVYLPHPFELPANHFVYSSQRTARLELLPDGFINYAKPSFRGENAIGRSRYVLRVLLRRIAARLFGLRYQPLGRGHITQYESVEYARCWADNASGFITQRHGITKLPAIRTQPTFEATEPGILVLDQELTELVDPRLEKAMRASLLETVRATKYQRVYYKSHPRGRNRAAEWRNKGVDVIDLSGQGSAEQIIAQLSVSHLFGYYSTPLLMTRGVESASVSILPMSNEKGIKKPEYLADIRSALLNAGVTVIAPNGIRSG